MEQPVAVRETYRAHVYKHKISLDESSLPLEIIKKAKKIFVIACGTSLFAGFVAKGVIEKFAKITVDVVTASEFRYMNPIIPDPSIIIAISQSGETLDTIVGINGSGMHTHISLYKNSKNIFFDPDDKYKLSVEAKRFIAGLLKHAPEITILTNQWVNSYKRLTPGYEAPVYLSWALRNRSDLIRIPVYRYG
ncbi:unnamed protein product, partial [marine sediment metagenome]